MFFNSLDFAVFLPIVFFIYWFVVNKNLKWQNMFLVIASYVFYGWWDARFLLLILFSTATDYFVGILIFKENNDFKRKLFLWISIIVNLGFLFFFKYYNFFLDNFVTAFSFLGMSIESRSLNIILPVGISFYTFQTMSYTIDIYKRKIEATKDFVAFMAFVSFFPQLVAGPIERATNLLPQFYVKRTFEYAKAVDGMRQILWGFLKKMIIADNCGKFADLIFNNYSDYSGSHLLLGAFFFTFQIYGDFSGYSDIAIGTSKLFGFNLMRNFAFPYFSRDIAEFWRRWHISLSTWFKDYLYIPLGGSRGNLWTKIRNTFIIFLVSGFWHGANWTFIAWGGLNAIYFLPLLLAKKNKNHIEIVACGKLFPSLRDFLSIIVTFLLTVIAWIFFRAENIRHAIDYISGIFSPSFFTIPMFSGRNREMVTVLVLIFCFILIEWVGRENEYAIQKINLKWWRPLRWSVYIFFIFILLIFMILKESEFIYFQF